ncbi:MAG TPA: hypothetical protein VFG09_14570 [Thermodesulfovibrionales bacterium]|nr:hypothetical protein [Thermodesulfovibrionales bacterium]
MDFESAVRTINNLLIKERPDTFNSSWVRLRAPYIYRFIQKNIRIETSGIDWDRITRALAPEFPRRWNRRRRNGSKPYRNKAEVGTVLQKYHDKLYTFIAPADKNDKYIRDIISIALVRIAQRGNTAAKREIIKLLRFTIEDWIEHCPKISCWRGYDQLIQNSIAGCIRRYRYSGSFIGYLFRTLEYAGRGLRPIIAYSLDDPIYSGDKRRIDIIGQDPETGELLIPGSSIHVP